MTQPDDAGFVLVPREATEAMCVAWSNASIGDYPLAGLSDREANAIAARIDWSAMIAAAPSAPDDAGEIARLRAALEAMLARHSGAKQNWTQAAVDAQQSGNRELSISIKNTALVALEGFPIEQARAALFGTTYSADSGEKL